MCIIKVLFIIKYVLDMEDSFIKRAKTSIEFIFCANKIISYYSKLGYNYY